ncbi:hypothetical protein JHS3_19420 [Jeongeupia sp. HS-3]|uniref:hypothetical protein n=1 Tax=Jeongeupia sp. HS-3 TaxID=1009682 RepID=UPI0018A5EC23|nr:hypothetical protein [Jeongeupia sp. HS-3]BCL76206.1 hypothetical protein JHS3_19420 [Jeongeupia sp. HS-3]
MPDSIFKHHDIVFSAEPADQPEHAAVALSHLASVSAQASNSGHRVKVVYPITDYTLAGLETYLQAGGFVLDSSALQRLRRTLAHYADDVERDNLSIPEYNVKTREMYVRMWAHHLHGDQDDTPEELRHYF